MELSKPWRYLAAAVLILLLALFLRIWPLPNESIGGDEVFSRRVALASFADGWNIARRDMTHPPLYYLLLRASLHGDPNPSPNSLRASALAAGAAAVATIFLIGFAVPALRWPALLAALLLAMNKNHIFYSQEARPYSLDALLVAWLLLWSALTDRFWRKWWYWVAGGLLMAAIVWTNYIGAFYCLGCILPMVLLKNPVAEGRRTAIPAISAAALGMVLTLPWLIPEIAVYREKSSLYAFIGWEGLPTWFELKQACANFIGVPYFRGATSLALGVGAVLAGCAFLPKLAKGPATVGTRMKYTLASMAVLPPLLLFLLTRGPFQLPIFGERQLLPSLVPALLLISYGLSKAASAAGTPLRSAALMGFGAAVLCALPMAPLLHDWPGSIRQPYQTVAKDLLRLEPAAPVYTTWPYGIGGPVGLYLNGARNIEPFAAVSNGTTSPPARFIVLYRPAIAKEAGAVQPWLSRYDVVSEKFYGSEFGTRLLLLSRR